MRAAWELPPRARRIHPQRYRLLGGGGTTSACAENTKNPHVEPPPTHGTTSACAENTATAANLGLTGRNYLRVRGEYLMGEIRNQEDLELPPRARRILVLDSGSEEVHGTTSACAENTKPKPVNACGGRNYLRVRGEYAAG